MLLISLPILLTLLISKIRPKTQIPIPTPETYNPLDLPNYAIEQEKDKLINKIRFDDLQRF